MVRRHNIRNFFVSADSVDYIIIPSSIPTPSLPQCRLALEVSMQQGGAPSATHMFPQGTITVSLCPYDYFQLCPE